ncbi:MAG TPA: hypothetical protein VKC53_02910 [Patescibacteria group bacterium]|nr:hypothetical protein [Patescibacteria group bacterium]
MPQQDKPAGGSPFEIITPGKSKKVGRTGLIVGISIVIFLILSVVAGVLLVRQQQNVAEKAVVAQCPGAQSCVVGATHIANCTPPEGDNSPSESDCNASQIKRIEPCGGVQLCCNGTAWTTDMTACAVASPSPTPTTAPSESPSPTPTPTSTSGGSANSCNGTCGSNSNCQGGLYCYSGFCRNPLCASDSTCGCGSATTTPTATATTKAASATSAASTTQTTPLPIPVTGTDWPTVAGIGVGVGAIIISLLIAL